MRRCLIPILIAALLCPLSASGAETPKYLALTFEGCPREAEARRLLDALAERGVRATFFLPEEDCPRCALLRSRGHELGILSHADPSLSRREIAAEIGNIRAGMPQDCRIRLLRHKGRDSLGFRQVAKALGMVIIEPGLNPAQATEGDVVLLEMRSAVDETVSSVDRLLDRGFTLVTVSELARLRGDSLHAGQRFGASGH